MAKQPKAARPLYTRWRQLWHKLDPKYGRTMLCGHIHPFTKPMETTANVPPGGKVCAICAKK